MKKLKLIIFFIFISLHSNALSETKVPFKKENVKKIYQLENVNKIYIVVMGKAAINPPILSLYLAISVTITIIKAVIVIFKTMNISVFSYNFLKHFFLTLINDHQGILHYSIIQ